MGFTNTTLEHPKPHQAQPDCAQKTASRDFFSYPVKTSYKNRSNSLKTSQEKSIYTYKIASGRGRWPSRDPIEEYGGTNLYAFCLNNGLSYWDSFGLEPYKPIYNSAKEAIIAGGEYALGIAIQNLADRVAAFIEGKKKNPTAYVGKDKPTSIYEYGGTVCCEQKDGKPTGKFYYAPAVTDNREGSIIFIRIKKHSKCKKGDKPAGYYHNHPKGPGLSGPGRKGTSGDKGIGNTTGLPIGATGRIGKKIATDIYDPNIKWPNKKTSRHFQTEKVEGNKPK